jgi:hypothetical protein
MFTYRRKLRSQAPTHLWGTDQGTDALDADLVLHLEVDEIGEDVELEIRRSFLFFFRRSQQAILKPGQVLSVNLCGAFWVSVRPTSDGDSYVNCTLVSRG